MYIGGRNGYFYAINEATGALIWKRFVGYVPGLTCGAEEGFTSTATVAPDPTTGAATVYVYGVTGYCMLNATTGTDVWPTAVVAIPSAAKSDYYAWSSSLVFDGHIYVGVAYACDRPLVRGARVRYSQADGSLDGTYYTTPSSTVGASIWSSPATDGTSVFATTGNGKATAIPF